MLFVEKIERITRRAEQIIGRKKGDLDPQLTLSILMHKTQDSHPVTQAIHMAARAVEEEEKQEATPCV